MGEEGEGCLRGQVLLGEGVEGALAAQRIEQAGYALAGAQKRIAWGDQLHQSVIWGGVIRWGEIEIAIPSVDASKAEVWPSDAMRKEVCERADRAEDEARYEAACKPRGIRRTLEHRFLPTMDIWLVGKLHKTPTGWRAEKTEAGYLLLAAEDPRAWVRQKSLLAWVFLLSTPLLCALCSALCFWPPVFESWPSKLGGVLCVAFFLGIQPIGTWLRDALRPPSFAFVHGWMDLSSSK